MSLLIEGSFIAKPVAVELGTNKKNAPELRVGFEIVDGLHAGRRVSYSGLFSEKSARYTKQAMIALGWTGKTSTTIAADAMRDPKPVPIEVEIRHWTNPDTGKESTWSSVRSVGRAPRESLRPLEARDVRDIDQWLADAGGNDTVPF